MTTIRRPLGLRFWLITLATVAGGVLWRARLLIDRKDRGDPPGYLRDLTVHGLRAMMRPLFPGKKPQAKTRPIA